MSADPDNNKCATPGCLAKHTAVTLFVCPTSVPTNLWHRAPDSSGRTKTTAFLAAYAYNVPHAPPQSPKLLAYQFGAGGIAIEDSRPVAIADRTARRACLHQ